MNISPDVFTVNVVKYEMVDGTKVISIPIIHPKKLQIMAVILVQSTHQSFEAV